MKAIYYIGNQKMELRDIPIPAPNEEEYLVKIQACGICGSDYEGFLGKTGRRIPPMIMGHECAGVIEKGIPGGKFQPGDQVAIFPKFYCGECETCKKGLVNLCPNAKFLGVMDCDGAMTEYCCVPERYLVPFCGSEILASMAEPAAVAYNAIFKIPEQLLQEAEHILVVGAGTIGLLALLWLKYRGAKHVIVSDTFAYRLDLAQKLGADAIVNPAQEDFLDVIAHLTGGKMCDISVEAVGISATASSSIEALHPSGTAIWIGNAAKMVSINMQKVVTTELKIRGSYIYDRQDFDRCVKLLTEDAIDISPLISCKIPLEEGVNAFHMLQENKEGRIIKIVLTNC